MEQCHAFFVHINVAYDVHIMTKLPSNAFLRASRLLSNDWLRVVVVFFFFFQNVGLYYILADTRLVYLAPCF